MDKIIDDELDIFVIEMFIFGLSLIGEAIYTLKQIFKKGDKND